MLTELCFVLAADAHRVELHSDERGVGPHTDSATYNNTPKYYTMLS